MPKLIISPTTVQCVGNVSKTANEFVVEHADGAFDMQAGQCLDVEPGEWVRYSTPGPAGAEYITVCTPAFSRASVHRDA
jgi:mannose-6-phosphate isomerase-like protein (cupin superfamily)